MTFIVQLTALALEPNVLLLPPNRLVVPLRRLTMHESKLIASS